MSEKAKKVPQLADTTYAHTCTLVIKKSMDHMVPTFHIFGFLRHYLLNTLTTNTDTKTNSPKAMDVMRAIEVCWGVGEGCFLDTCHKACKCFNQNTDCLDEAFIMIT